MRYYIILFFSVLSFCFSCNRNGGVPDGIIPPDKMIAVLTQVYIVDGRMMNVQQYPDTLYKYGTAQYLAVFKKFGVDSAQFRKSCLYYTSNPQQMLDMNVKILADLQIKADSLKKLMGNRQSKHPSAGVPSSALNHAYTAAPGAAPAVGNAPPHPASIFHPGAPAATTHPASTFHPGAQPAGSVAQQPATVLVHGHVVTVGRPFAPPQSIKAKQAILKAMKAKRDSLRKSKIHP